MPAPCFEYEKPELWDFSEPVASGVSCYIDCDGDEICPRSDDH